jgi:hypothetical protein
MEGEQAITNRTKSAIGTIKPFSKGTSKHNTTILQKT